MKILDRFKNTVSDMPDNVFLSDDSKQGEYTFKFIDECASKVYAYLHAYNIGAEDIVAIKLHRSALIPIVIIGVMKAGAAFLVIGERSDTDTVSYILNDAKPKIIVDAEIYQKMMEFKPLEGYREPDDHDLAMLVYSSGSTGIFKGCMHEYGKYTDVLNRLDATINSDKELWDEYLSGTYALTAGFYTISAIFSILFCMATGQPIDIVPYDILADYDKFNQRLIDKKATETCLSPAQIKSGKISSPYLQWLDTSFEMFGGIYLGNPVLFNCYGMTESAQALACFEVDKAYDNTPVGKPYPDVVIKIVDENGNEVKNNEIGEIWFASEFFRGYINNPDMTSQVLANGWYHTGDIGKFLPDGNLLILGRKVDIKKTEKGYIIPHEIVMAAKNKLGLSWAFVRIFDDDIICLYYCDDIKLTVDMIRNALSSAVPEYAMPTHCMKIDRVPYFPSGKTNRKAFKKPEV